MLGITSTRNYIHNRRQIRHNSRVRFYVPAGWRTGTIKTVCNADSFGDVWVLVKFYEPAIKADTVIWLKSTSVKVIKKTAA
jgi:hypothetical protein